MQYRHYIGHFESTFQHIPAPSFNEWAIRMRISNDTSDILHASDSTNSSNNNTPVNCEEDMLESKKDCRGEGWSKQPAAALVDSWKHL